jgi:hypothetical protein
MVGAVPGRVGVRGGGGHDHRKLLDFIGLADGSEPTFIARNIQVPKA